MYFSTFLIGKPTLQIRSFIQVVFSPNTSCNTTASFPIAIKNIPLFINIIFPSFFSCNFSISSDNFIFSLLFLLFLLKRIQKATSSFIISCCIYKIITQFFSSPLTFKMLDYVYSTKFTNT